MIQAHFELRTACDGIHTEIEILEREGSILAEEERAVRLPEALATHQTGQL